VVIDCLAEVTLRFIRVAEIPVRPALSRLVAHLLCNRQVLRVVLDGLDEVSLRLIRDAEVPVRPPSPARSPTCFTIDRHCVWYSMTLLKSPCEKYAVPRFPYALPSPARSPTCFAIARS